MHTTTAKKPVFSPSVTRPPLYEAITANAKYSNTAPLKVRKRYLGGSIGGTSAACLCRATAAEVWLRRPLRALVLPWQMDDEHWAGCGLTVARHWRGPVLGKDWVPDLHGLNSREEGWHELLNARSDGSCIATSYVLRRTRGRRCYAVSRKERHKGRGGVS